MNIVPSLCATGPSTFLFRQPQVTAWLRWLTVLSSLGRREDPAAGRPAKPPVCDSMAPWLLGESIRRTAGGSQGSTEVTGVPGEAHARGRTSATPVCLLCRQDRPLRRGGWRVGYGPEQARWRSISLDHCALLDEGDDAHGVCASGTHARIDFVHLRDKARPGAPRGRWNNLTDFLDG